jgi:hypothetical protein
MMAVDPQQAKELMTEVKQLVLLTEKDKSLNSGQQKRVAVLKEEIGKEYDRVLGISRIEPSIYQDLSIIKKEFFGERMTLVGDKLWILDTNSMTVIELGMDNKDSDIIAGGEKMAGAKLIAGLSDREAIVLANEGLVKIAKNQEETIINRDKDWGEITAIGSFGSNIYFLDSTKSEIYRFKPGDGVVWNESRWLAPGEAPDLSQGVEMLINGEVWILEAGGRIRKFVRGMPKAYTVNYLDKPLGKVCCMALDENVWVADKENNRIVELNAQGEYLRQYVTDLSRVTDMIVKDKVIWLLAGGKVWRVEVGN